jgi:DNA-binding response OmpR family regulator
LAHPLHSFSSIPAQRPLILIIEDEAQALSIRQKVLQQDGYNVIGVNGPNEALSCLRYFPICAIIADHMLSGTTGVELAKKMKKLKPDVPIISFSGTLPERFDGVDVYINKGEPTANFLRIVRQVVERYCS